MSEPRTASNGHPRQGTLAFDEPGERDGITVITATNSRTHAATRGAGEEPGTSRFDAQLSGNRALGAFVVDHGTVRWRPALDLTKVITTAELAVGGVLVARQIASRPSGAKALVTMGPGGWVSMKGGTVAVRRASRPFGRPTPIRPASTGERAPLWARVLSAVPLQALMR